MDFLQQSFSVKFEYKVYFTSHLFAPSNRVFQEFINSNRIEGAIQKLLFVVDENLKNSFPELENHIKNYFLAIDYLQVIPEILYIKGGEASKNDENLFYKIVNAINNNGIDRHSYLAAIGGGSTLDLAGYAASISHRGIRHIRIPTTVLSQNDSGVGVKNGINFFNKKNFLGTFAPPIAVFNDFQFLTALSNAEWRSGIAEAIKVALIKDETFFIWLEKNANLLIFRDMPSIQYLIKRCAELHLQHIASGDPFEKGSSRPLDFGHWSAHKLEQLTDFTIRHTVPLSFIFWTFAIIFHKAGMHNSIHPRVKTHVLVTAADLQQQTLELLKQEWHSNESRIPYFESECLFAHFLYRTDMVLLNNSEYLATLRIFFGTILQSIELLM